MFDLQTANLQNDPWERTQAWIQATEKTSDLPHPQFRPRRLRSSAAMRNLTAQARLHPNQLILPVFVRDGIEQPVEISSMPGVYHHTLDSLADLAKECVQAGVGGIIVFGVPKDEDKDAIGSAAWDQNGIMCRALTRLQETVGGQLVIMADTCLDEFTDHGHCGVVLADGSIDNDATLPLYARMAVAQAAAGADIVAPSGMMDGQVAAIRAALDECGFQNVPIMAYSAKYASAFFGPFREAVACSLQGDRKTYQQDPRNSREGLYETELDLAEGADLVMVKPAGYYLDVLNQVARISPVPVAAYQVSGEYSMIMAAAAKGWVDRDRIIDESLVSIIRAGADLILTYFALEAARRLTY